MPTKAPLMKSVSGIRGIVGASFTPELITEVSAAFAAFTKKGTIIIGRDSRPTGEVISNQVQAVLAQCGCTVIDCGVVPTPTVQLMVEEFKADGGIVLSASHNPIQWNAFKLINSSGTFLNSKEMSQFFKLSEKPPTYVPWDKVGQCKKSYLAHDIHIDTVLKTINIKKIKKAKLKVVLDSVNGAGSLITQDLLKKLGCKVIPLYCEIDGQFPRGAEPKPENLKDLGEAVRFHKADIGFAQDPDADRLAIVNELGKPLGEEYTLTLVTEHLLAKESGRVVINLSTTRAIEDVAAKYGAQVKRTAVGEINVADEMRKNGARIGGEGNGGVISPEVHLGRDSLAGIGYVLEMMAERKKPISRLKEELPQYHMVKDAIKLKPGFNAAKIMKKLQTAYKTEKISTVDGLRIDFIKDANFAGSWIHLRPSNTEPIFRIIAEANTIEIAKKLVNLFKKLVK